ncbi:glutamate 5-kinase [Alicyclobacillus curvatus]|nr:glutamate 5-kinase [Alicyclobacillus curvatus]
MVVKIGSSSITDEDGRLSVEKLERIVRQIAVIQTSGMWQVVLVSSGAVAAGLGKLGWRRWNITMPEKQAAASVGQGLLMHTYEQLFHSHGIAIGQVLLTKSDIEDRSRFVHVRNTLMTLLRHGIVPVVNENDTVAVDEIRFGDNDTLAGLVALVTEAEELILLTDIDGLYTGNPSTDPSAVRLSDVFEITREMEGWASGAGSSVGTGGMRTKIAAAKIAVAGGCNVVVAAAAEAEVLQKIVAGQHASIGTRFHAKSVPVSLRKAWLMHGSRSEGKVSIDAGAVQALTENAASLLLPGVTGVAGEFREGATVDLVGPDGEMVARGIVSFAARDLHLLLARQQSGEKLHDLQEVVHRNDMAFQA